LAVTDELEEVLHLLREHFSPKPPGCMWASVENTILQ